VLRCTTSVRDRTKMVLKRALLVSVIVTVGPIAVFRWMPPPTSAFMVEKRVANLFRARRVPVRYHWVSLKNISPHMRLAVIAAEDQKFPTHWGFDFESISKAMEKGSIRSRERGASTISQQVAKNLFLWPGKSYLRKGLEAYLTVVMEALWPKRRILEIYLNIAEFGEGTYGVGAAAERYFRKKPSQLTPWESALLAAVLPSPKRMHADRPSGYVSGRAQWILWQMSHMDSVEAARKL
jgi:monofunctional biosynthetic peptidoglycan transglycosylase